MKRYWWISGSVSLVLLASGGFWLYRQTGAGAGTDSPGTDSPGTGSPGITVAHSPATGTAIATPIPTANSSPALTKSPPPTPAITPVASPAATKPSDPPAAAVAPGSSPAVSASPKRSSTAPGALSAAEQAQNEKAKAEFWATSGTVDALIEMKVAIAEGVSTLVTGASMEATLLDQNYQPLKTLAAGESYTVQPTGNGMSFGDANLPAIVWVQPATPSGLVRLGNRQYHGILLLVNDGGRLWAVNHVNLREYLHSVVGSEVSASWDGEALKAQSVAARSYALTYRLKPMSGLFDLGATEYYQVYKGIESEADSIRKAVDSTAGEYVSYKGGVVESLYAASDDIVAEAFQGQGMSQLGALSLAEQGYSYTQILGNYYPQTKVGRFEKAY